MSNDPPQLLQRLWTYCNILRGDGLSYDDGVERHTFLPFLRVSDDQAGPPFNNGPACGTGGFLIAAHDCISNHHSLDPLQEKRLAAIAEDLK